MERNLRLSRTQKNEDKASQSRPAWCTKGKPCLADTRPTGFCMASAVKAGDCRSRGSEGWGMLG